MEVKMLGHPRVEGINDFFGCSSMIEALSERFPSVHGTVNIVLIGERRMARLNRIYKGRSGPAEILTFPYSQDDIDRGNESPVAGEIYMCWKPISRKAETLGVKADHYLVRLAVHGMLHLTGFSHGDEQSAMKMEREEKNHLKLFIDKTDLKRLFD